jgi:hypothetical protein
LTLSITSALRIAVGYERVDAAQIRRGARGRAKFREVLKGSKADRHINDTSGADATTADTPHAIAVATPATTQRRNDPAYRSVENTERG